MKVRTAVIMTSLLWIALFGSCASLKVTTWFLDGKEHNELIRKNSHGELIGELSYVAADGYRCYSPVDDEAWRNRLSQLSACCGGRGALATEGADAQ